MTAKISLRTIPMQTVRASSRRRPKVALLVAVGVLLGLIAGPTMPSVESVPSPSKHLALPDSYRITLALELNGSTREFSMLTAARHFAMEPPDVRLNFRGRLWQQDDGRELLDFVVELQHHVPDDENAHTRLGSYTGSVYVELGKVVTIAESPYSKLSVTVRRQ